MSAAIMTEKPTPVATPATATSGLPPAAAHVGQGDVEDETEVHEDGAGLSTARTRSPSARPPTTGESDALALLRGRR